MVVHMRHTRAHRDNRRSHHALKTRQLGVCEKCKSPRPPHVACATCGTYKGRQVIKMADPVEAAKSKKENA